MHEVRLPLTEVGFIAATRVLLGVGLGLLLASRLSLGARRRLGGSLVAMGAVTTVPLLADVLSRLRRPA